VEELRSRVAVVTGGASGIGRGLVGAFGAEGMKVVVADVDEIRSKSAVDELHRNGVECFPHVTDVRDPDSVESLAAATYERFGAAHVVCNNAGVSSLGRQWETSLADWQWVIDVCLWGVIHGIRSFVPRMLVGGEEGHVVSTASMGGLMTSPMIGPYTAAKHGVVGISKGLRAELAGTNVGVSVVCPGEIRTSIVDAMRAHIEEEAGGELSDAARATMDTLAGRLVTQGIPADEAAAIVVDAVKRNQFWILPNGGAHLPSVQEDLDELFASA
jgi:NAD(P)-dependent dehydrogenase (short-subunit alcohol dehydrogenase family)